MRDEEQAQFLALIFATAELYDKTPTKAAALLYWDALRHLSMAQVKEGIGRHVRDKERGRFMPRPADIVPPKRSAFIAWSEVCEAAQRHGRYASVQFEDGTTNAVIRDMGGWPWLCDQNLDEPWTEKAFMARYEEYQDYGRESRELLVGIHERDNRAAGYLEYVPAPVLIASSERTQIGQGDKVGLLLGEKR